MKKKKNEASANWFFRSVVIMAILLTAFLGRFAYLNRATLNERVARGIADVPANQRVEVIYRFGAREGSRTETLYRADLTTGLSNIWHEFEAVGIDRSWMELSPDGRYLAYAAEPDGNQPRIFANDVYIVHLETGNIENITQSPDINDSLPQWSPDGEWLVYNNDVGNDMDIFMVNFSGDTTPMNLTDNAPNVDTRPKWSPDGTRLAILSSRPPQRNEWGIDVWTLDNDRWVTSRVVDDVIYIVDVQWSPDGQWLAYKTNEPDGIWVVPSDGSSEPVLISHLTNRADYFSWSPDSQWVVYDASSNSGWELHVTNIDTMQVENLTQSSTNDQHPLWLPDGHIVFLRDRALYSMDFATGEMVQLTKEPTAGYVNIIGWQYAEQD